MESLDNLEGMLAECSAKNDVTTMLQIFMIKSLMCELDKKFGAFEELLEDAQYRETIIAALIKHDPKLLGNTFHAEAQILPLELIVICHDSN